jgi:hypothetical protein
MLSNERNGEEGLSTGGNSQLVDATDTSDTTYIWKDQAVTVEALEQGLLIVVSDDPKSQVSHILRAVEKSSAKHQDEHVASSSDFHIDENYSTLGNIENGINHLTEGVGCED